MSSVGAAGIAFAPIPIPDGSILTAIETWEINRIAKIVLDSIQKNKNVVIK